MWGRSGPIKAKRGDRAMAVAALFSFRQSPGWQLKMNHQETIHGAARIGPNAIIRMAEALQEQGGRETMEKVFRKAGLVRYVDDLPEQMVDEAEVTALHQALRAELSGEGARAASLRAGALTGDYLLANRIPRAAQLVLKLLPASVASRILLQAIGKNAWTFSGSGEFSARSGYPVSVAVAGCPICRGANARENLCDYYAATFERLYVVLVSPRAKVREVECQATGADACRFEITW